MGVLTYTAATSKEDWQNFRDTIRRVQASLLNDTLTVHKTAKASLSSFVSDVEASLRNIFEHVVKEIRGTNSILTSMRQVC